MVMMGIGCTGSNYKEESIAGPQWKEYYSRSSEMIEKDLKNIEEARNKADSVALSNSGSKLYYDSLTAIDDRKLITWGFGTQKARANDELFKDALNNSKDAGLCIVSEVYELKQGRESVSYEYKVKANEAISLYELDIMRIDTDIY